MKLKKKIEPAVLYIEWTNSAILPGWTKGDKERCSVHNRSVNIRSVGILVRETERDLTLSTCLSENGYVNNAISIPRSAIVKVRKLSG